MGPILSADTFSVQKIPAAAVSAVYYESAGQTR